MAKMAMEHLRLQEEQGYGVDQHGKLIPPRFIKFREEMEQVSGSWDGDNSGYAEDRAHTADEIIEHIDAIHILLQELNNL